MLPLTWLHVVTLLACCQGSWPEPWVEKASLLMPCWLQVYESCEALFCALADEVQKYTDWLALGDSGNWVATHLTAFAAVV